ncbi:MAG: tRNA (adenosine(37)-N6)-threonylcarbamoyltransferase complex ATPase subunit type 1 TsaE [Parcubacteria group bacterium]
MKYISKNTAETNQFAKDFLDTIEPADKAVVVALHGDLGAGKTAFAQAVGEILGVKENMHSPTFVIMKIYSPVDTECLRGFRNLIHIDAYRLEKDADLLHLGWEEMTKEPENLIFIEWPENVSGTIPADAKKIFFQFIDENTREINYES